MAKALPLEWGGFGMSPPGSSNRRLHHDHACAEGASVHGVGLVAQDEPELGSEVGGHAHLPSALRESRKSMTIQVSSGFIWEIPA